MAEKEKIIIKTIALPESLYLRVCEEAQKECRNITAEIRYIITRYFKEEGVNDVNDAAGVPTIIQKI